MYINLRISKVRLKNPLTLIISGTYPSGHLNHAFEIEYIGTDVIIKKGNLLYDQEECILQQLKPLIRYGPFNLKEVKEVLLEEEIQYKYKAKYKTDN